MANQPLPDGIEKASEASLGSYVLSAGFEHVVRNLLRSPDLSD